LVWFGWSVGLVWFGLVWFALVWLVGWSVGLVGLARFGLVGRLAWLVGFGLDQINVQAAEPTDLRDKTVKI